MKLRGRLGSGFGESNRAAPLMAQAVLSPSVRRRWKKLKTSCIMLWARSGVVADALVAEEGVGAVDF